MTEEDDIGFAIYYDPTGRADNLTNMECVFPYIRLECSNVRIDSLKSLLFLGSNFWITSVRKSWTM
jgi:hypothetical protein